MLMSTLAKGWVWREMSRAMAMCAPRRTGEGGFGEDIVGGGGVDVG